MFFAIVFGIILGLVSGALPGIGAASIMLTTYFILIKFTIPELLMCFIAMIISSQYIATVTAIYTGIPGAESAFPTSMESKNLIRYNITGEAVAQNAIASLIGNTVGILLLGLILPFSVLLMKSYGVITQSSILILAFFLVIFIGENKLKSFLLIISSFALMMIGFNEHSFETINFGLSFLDNGLSWVALTMGAVLGHSMKSTFSKNEFIVEKPLGLYDGFKSMNGKIKPALRGSFVGFFIGMIPGLSYILSSILCYKMERSKYKEDDKEGILKSLIQSDAAHCSGILAMLLPLLAFGIPITASEGVLYNMVTMNGTTGMLMEYISNNIGFVLLTILIVNLVSMIVAWRFGNILVKILCFDMKILNVILFGIAGWAVYYIESMTGGVILPLVTYLVTFIVFYKFKLNPLPFIFGVLVFPVFLSSYYSIIQLYGFL